MTPIANILQPLIDVFESVLVFFHGTVGFGWGLSIIALTVVVRAALVPLTYKQLKSMQALQRLQPQIKELQAKYKDDKQRLQQETMKFYQEHKVNPFGACLPLVLQMPVFIALFYMLQDDLRLDICPRVNPAGTADPKPCGSTGDSQFFFIPDITDKATGTVLIVLLVLYVGSQLFSSVVMAVVGRPDAAPHHDGAAVRLRALHHQLPCRPARLLDHDEPMDDRPAVRHPQDGRPSRRRQAAAAAATPAGARAADSRTSEGRGRAGRSPTARPRPRSRAGRPRRRRRRGARRSAPGAGADGHRARHPGARARAARADRRGDRGRRRRWRWRRAATR